MDVGRHPRINLLAYSEVEKVEGELGAFRVSVRKKARYVDETKCTGCGACAEKCPTTTSDAYNLGLSSSKAIYRYFAQGIPSTYTINASECRQLQGKKCGVCAKTCQAGAIDYKQEDRVIDIEAGAIIVSTGYDLFDARRIPEYGYGRIRNVLTALELERFLSASGPTHGHVYRPSDLDLKVFLQERQKAAQKASRGLERFEKQHGRTSGEFMSDYESGITAGEEFEPWAEQVRASRRAAEELETVQKQVDEISSAKRLAFIQCVGSRDKRFNSYCSGFCCMHAIKEAIIAREHEPESEVYIFGMDIRAVGKGFEEYRNRGATESHISYVRSRVAEITEQPDGSPVLWYEDTRRREVVSMPVDIVILSTGCEPSSSTRKIAEVVGIDLNEFGFFATSAGEPLDTSRQGVFVCGCSQSPMDIPESVAQASSAAARAAQVLSSPGKIRLAS